VNSALVARDNARTSASDAVRSGYVQAKGAIVNYADTFFSNPQTANPIIKIYTQSSNAQISIDIERLAVTDTLKKWKADIDSATSTDGVSILITRANDYIVNMKLFLDDLSVIVATLSPGGAGLPQTIIDSYVVTMNMALNSLNQAVTIISTAKTALEQAESAYTQANSDFILKNSGSSNQAIRSQQAAVDSLAAVVAKGRIYSPIDGTVTRADPHEGEYVSPGQSGFAVQSEGAFKIEAYIPEADIAKVAIGNHADVTLDAYGQDVIFSASVTLVDPAETMLEGVPTYKVTLMFDKADIRIKSGMTANTEILTHEHDGVLSVPTRAILNADTSAGASSSGTKYVRVLNSDGKTFKSVNVVVGLKSSDGSTEIVSGLNAGDKVVTYTK
jgi:RND family efflux transporter MFP subunit